MAPRRSSSDDGRNDSSEQLFPVLASETMRNAASSRHSSHESPQSQKPPEEKISLFWRIFGGTILSIVALVVISAYQGLNSGIHDLRIDLAKANEARGELVKKDEWTSSRTKIWDKFTEVQKDLTAASTPIAPMKVQIDKLEAASHAMDAETRDVHELHASLKERLAQIDLQLAQTKLTQKDVQSLQQSLQGIQDKLAFREQQLKQSEDDRKEMAKELQALRERLAKVEATKESRPVPAKTTSKPKMPESDDDK